MKLLSLLVGVVSAGLVLRKPNDAPLNVVDDAMIQEPDRAEPMRQAPATYGSIAEACDACEEGFTKKAQPTSVCVGMGGNSWHLLPPGSASTHAMKENDACVCNYKDQANHGETTCQSMVEF